MNKQIAEHLLSIKAVSLQPNEPFTWASGIKSPIYCDNRLTLSYPAVRCDIAHGLAGLIREHFATVDVIAGTATAGIPHAAWVSDELDLPMIYVRSSAKGHGKGNQIEGKIEKGNRVVVVEDLISTGGSSLKCVDALLEKGCEVLGVVSIFTYGLDKAKNVFEERGIRAYSLCDYETLIKTAVERNDIEEKDLQKLIKWKQNPADESWINN